MPDDRGQTTLLMVAILGVAVVMVVGLGPVGRVLTLRAQARTAADAAALAGAAEGEEAAEALAAQNEATLDGFAIHGDEVVVEVTIEGVTAFGRAQRIAPPASPAGGDGADPGGLTPAMLAAIARAEVALGRSIPIVSGYRSREQQEALWANRARNPYPVAPPGRSKHQQGLAIDVPRGFVDDLLTVAAAAGLCQPLPVTDPVHFELC